MNTLLQDLMYASRQLHKSPGFTAVAVATLALGIGASTAIFSIFNATLLRPLPYPQAERVNNFAGPFECDPKILIALVARDLRLMDPKPLCQFSLRYALGDPQSDQ